MSVEVVRIMVRMGWKRQLNNDCEMTVTKKIQQLDGMSLSELWAGGEGFGRKEKSR